jgi:hypothetical protein
MQIVREVYPRFLEQLSKRVYPIYEKLANEGTLIKQGYNFRGSRNPWAALADGGILAAAISNWAAGFNADVEWIRIGALRTMAEWHSSPDWREWLRWCEVTGWMQKPPRVPPFEFQHPRWEPHRSTWSDYRKSVQRTLEESLRAYEGVARSSAEELGLIRMPRQYSPQNLEFFALYQFARKSSKKIADHYAPKGTALNESSVLKGIRAAAELVGWNDLRDPNNRKTR